MNDIFGFDQSAMLVSSFNELPPVEDGGLFGELDFDERKQKRKSRKRKGSHGGRCFTNPRTGVRMRRSGRRFKKC